MASVCEVCGKAPIFGKRLSHSHRRTNRRWNPNVQRVRAIVDGSPNPRPDQFKRIGVAGREARSFRDPASRPGLTYIYRVRAAGPGTVSPYSTEVIVKVTTAAEGRR